MESATVTIEDSLVCTSCKEEKPLTGFHKDKTKITGYRGTCKACRAEYDARPDQKARRLANVRLWKAENPERNLSHVRASNQKRYQHVSSQTQLPAGWQELVTCFYGKCLHPDCDATEGLTTDHVVSLNHLGAHTFDNLQALCQRHNSEKWSRDTDYRAEIILSGPSTVSLRA